MGMPPSTILARHLTQVSANNSSVAVVKDANLKMYHVMSVKQSIREDLAQHSYQFSCRAADWSKMSFSHVPMQFEPGNRMCQTTFNICEELESFKRLGVYEEIAKEKATRHHYPRDSSSLPSPMSMRDQQERRLGL